MNKLVPWVVTGAAAVFVVLAGGYFLIVKQGMPGSFTQAQLMSSSTASTTDNASNKTSIGATQIARSQNLLSTALAGGRVLENGYHKYFTTKPDPSYPGATLNAHMIFVSSSGEKTQVPDNVWFQIDAGTAFAETGKRGGQNITSFDIPVHPFDQDTIFLSTAEPLEQAYSRITNRIHSYNLKTSELEEVYSETVGGLANPTARIFRTVGIDGSRVIILRDNPDNSPGPCSSIWSDHKDNMEYLELANIQDGLRVYIVPSYKVEEGQLYAEKCLNDFETQGGI